MFGLAELDNMNIANMPVGPGGELHRPGAFLYGDVDGRAHQILALLRFDFGVRQLIKDLIKLREIDERRALEFNEQAGVFRCD